MAQVQTRVPQPRPTTPPKRPLNAPMLSPSRMPDPVISPTSYKTGHLNLDTFSPVDQNGSFRFDRVLKSGKVHRRTKKKGAWKPSWKPAYIVLRPNLLSIYENDDETGFRASIALSDITAVAPVRKLHTNHVFGIFTPSKNFHFQGVSDKDSADWITKLRAEATTGEQDEARPVIPQSTNQLDHHGYDTTDLSADESPGAPASPEPLQRSIEGTIRAKPQGTRSRRTSNLQDYSGNEMLTTSHSDFSDFQPGSLPKSHNSALAKVGALSPIASAQQLRPPLENRNTSQLSVTNTDIMSDPERVIRQGWLQVLRTKTGVKAWKSMWCVLRPKNLCFYKNKQEYSALKLLPMNSIIDAAEVDPISRTKRFCFQVIIEEKTYRLCAADDEDLAKWLGALKSVLTKRAEAEKARSKAREMGMNTDGLTRVETIVEATNTMAIR